MKTDKLSIRQIQEIAQEVTQGYTPNDLPSLQEVSWAFPVEGRDRVYYNSHGYTNKIPNIQEGNALREIMTFRNFKNILQYLSEGKTVSRGCIPNHTFPCDDAEDGAYMVYPYLAIKEKEDGRKDAPVQEGFFWETLPSGLVKAVLKVERTGRGSIVNENGESIERVGNIAYVDADLTRQYLENMRDAYELGREHFEQVIKLKGQAKNYPQLIADTNPENWQEGDEFQWGYYSKKEPRLVCGKVLSNNEKKIDIDIGEGAVWNDIEIPLLKKYGEHGLLWKLIPAGVKR